jgi:hypothetical protein
MPRTGRPKKVIDWEEVDKLCAIACTGVEIAAFIEVEYDTLVRAVKRKFKMTFAEYYEQKSALGNVSLRRRQFKAAQDGDRAMLIWLGKQRLGQSEKLTSVNKTELEARVQTIDKEEIRKANEELESEC